MSRKRTKIQKRDRKLEDGVYRERCYGCYRPIEICFCDSIPRVKNQTDILILQHQRERSHPFNTARIVSQSLDRCRLIFDRNERFADSPLPISPGAGLLYPGKDSQLLTELRPDQRPEQLVILDGTWHHAKTLFRDIPQLQKLPQYKLAPSTPGQYRIRLEPTDTSLSTLEATVQALQQLEPETQGTDALLGAFNKMVEQQLSHPNASYGDGTPKPKKANLNVPTSLLGDLSNIVVAYGEATPVEYRRDEGWSSLNQKKKLASTLPPVYWVARRLSTNGDGDTFVQTIESQFPIAQKFLGHMELAESDFADAVSVETFRENWNSFLQEDDLLVVHNEGTIRLLEQAGARIPDHEILKSINHDPKKEFSQLGDFFAARKFPVDESMHRGRAGTRLAHAATLVRYLKSVFQS